MRFEIESTGEIKGGMIRKLKRSMSLGVFGKGVTTFLNPYSYLIARKNYYLFDEGCDRVFVDGQMLVFFLRVFGIRVRRYSFDMTSLAAIVFEEAEKLKKSTYFVGSEPGMARLAVSKIKKEYPSLIVSGVRDGFFSSSDELARFNKKLLSLNPDIVIAGMGTPIQEQFLVNLKASGWQGQGFTCGGFLHQTAKSGVEYYPYWMNKLHLRWLYRMYDEPNLVKRYFYYYPKFIVVFLLDMGQYRFK